MQQIFSGQHLRAVGRHLERKRILVTFGFRRKAGEGFPPYRPIETALSRDMGHLAIDTAANDWFLNAETLALEAGLAEFARERRILQVGFSMGGYAALRFARVLVPDQSLLLAPQYSVLPAKAPYETRYLADAAALDPLLDHLAPPEGASMAGLVIYDPRLQPLDRQHAQSICRVFTGLRPMAFPFGGHPPLQNFEDRLGYKVLLRYLLTGRLTAVTARGLHRAHREASLRYMNRIGEYLALRAARHEPPPELMVQAKA